MESSTNSPAGSYHWFSTLLGTILHSGEYIKNNYNSPNLTEERLLKLGNIIYDNAKELIDGRDLINQDNLTKDSMHQILLVNAIKFLDDETRLLLIEDLKQRTNESNK